jgi:hypothetical protein
MLTMILGDVMQKSTRTAFVVGLLVLLIVAATAQGKDDIQVACYLGDRFDSIDVGNVDVFNPELAAANCNMVYNDCRGNCFGCYADENSVEVCIDKGSRRFYR